MAATEALVSGEEWRTTAQIGERRVSEHPRSKVPGFIAPRVIVIHGLNKTNGGAAQ